MNSVHLIGRITAKPELRYTNSNVPYTRFNLAIDRPKKEDGTKETDFLLITAWRKQAENVCKYLDKGSLIAVEGKIRTDKYQDSEGNNRLTTYVLADNVQFLETKKANNDFNVNQQEDVTDNDPFADFQNVVEIDNNFLD